MILVGVGCLLVSALLTWVLAKYVVTKDRILMIVGGFACGGAAYIGTAGIPMDGLIKIAISIFAGIAGACLLKGNENGIIAYSTSFLGAVLLMHGLSCYLGGFPTVAQAKDLESQKLTGAFFGYIGGMIVFTIIGGRHQKTKADEEGSFMS